MLSSNFPPLNVKLALKEMPGLLKAREDCFIFNLYFVGTVPANCFWLPYKMKD